MWPPLEKKIGKRTIFNLLGPLSSPADVKKQVIGVFDEKWIRIHCVAYDCDSTAIQ